MSVRLDNLKAQREAAGHSITRLATLANVSDLTITTLEHIGVAGHGGTCTHDVADRLCDALGISRATAGFVDLG
jgi:predicted transcriptional regulator